MEDVIAIIVTILIGIGAKWLEDRHKNKDKRKPAKAHTPQQYPRHYGAESAGEQSAVSYSKPAKKAVEVKREEKHVPLFEEGQCAVTHEPVEDIHAIDSTNDDEALAAHYARWRQAIIDAQIITPKFKD
ncbi:MAG: hypothetical protein K2K68_05325 [Duncaniella sp.]|nr:hypothetical protein [Duncaniella sp.]MDE6581412.1 hypothetical protein [Duncaniella sp.]